MPIPATCSCSGHSACSDAVKGLLSMYRRHSRPAHVPQIIAKRYRPETEGLLIARFTRTDCDITTFG